VHHCVIHTVALCDSHDGQCRLQSVNFFKLNASPARSQ
jgi:hypothetical protein